MSLLKWMDIRMLLIDLGLAIFLQLPSVMPQSPTWNLSCTDFNSFSLKDIVKNPWWSGFGVLHSLKQLFPFVFNRSVHFTQMVALSVTLRNFLFSHCFCLRKGTLYTSTKTVLYHIFYLQRNPQMGYFPKTVYLIQPLYWLTPVAVSNSCSIKAGTS